MAHGWQSGPTDGHAQPEVDLLWTHVLFFGADRACPLHLERKLGLLMSAVFSPGSPEGRHRISLGREPQD
jgi:hypothetical protein